MSDPSSETVSTAAPAADTVVDAGSTSAPVVTTESTPVKEPSILDAIEKSLSPDKGVEAASPAAE